MGEKGLIIAPIFGNGMILQRDTMNRIYGKETMASTVSVLFQENIYSANVDCKHNFTIELPPVEAGGPYSMTIKGSSEIEISDILFGDVYVLSGQSNMELPLHRVLDVSEEEIKETCEPAIRQYLIPATYNFTKSEQFMYENTWKEAKGDDLLSFSAVGYFFAKEIKEKYNVPVGLIMTAVGGSKIESWMSPVALSKFGDYEFLVEVFKDKDYFKKYLEEQQDVANRWIEKLEATDEHGIIEDTYKDWNTCKLPSLTSDYSEEPFCGTLYLAKEVYIEEEPTGDAFLYMGTLINADRTFVNGVEVGRTEYRYPPRKYNIPAGTLKKGMNLIHIRLVVSDGNGGAIKGRPYYLSYHKENGEKETIDLCGEWKYRIGKAMECRVPNVIFPPLLPIGFYNTVVKPLSKVSVKGVLWYQGESNTGDGKDYAEKFSVLVQEWRELFKTNLPFIYVQLSNYQEPLETSKENGWGWLRNEQTKCLSIDNVAMVVTLDIGDENDLHPQNKKEVGQRVATATRKLVYGEEIAYSGPVPAQSFSTEDVVTIVFDHLENGDLVSELNNFEVSDCDNVFYPAKAVRKGHKVELSSEMVTSPTFVRYAWLDAPTDINFYNESGLPACGFVIEINK